MEKTVALPAGKNVTSFLSGLNLLRLVVVLIVLGLFIGGALMGKELVETYRVHAQIAQIAALDEAVEHFREKYDGLPGDLLAVMADRQGLPAGDGKPGHGDGDGKISPCNLGWQWHLGCETALFWSHLSVSGMISTNFTADSRFTNGRLTYVGSMTPYLPQAAIGEGIFIAVWNSDASQPSPKPALKYGNYYEISAISGVEQEKMVDDSRALTPLQAHAIDTKMDDGMPYAGRVLANGDADWPKETWGTFARRDPAGCVFTNKTYNTGYFLHARAPLCHLAIRLE